MASRAAELREAICAEVRSACVARFGDDLRAIVLTGSVARDEATFTASSEGAALRGDAEFLLVFQEKSSPPAAAAVSRLTAEISKNLAQKKITAKMDLSAVPPKYFRRLPPHIFSYELRECGKVIHGDAAILELIPAMKASELDREDAWRLLCNRLIEMLATESDGDARRYALLKLYLDMTTSLLVFKGAYAPSYRARRDALLRLAAPESAAGGFPFPLGKFSNIVSGCTDEKLGTNPGSAEIPLNSEEAIGYAHLLWRWELMQLGGAAGAGADQYLFKTYMRRQPAKRRVRGWLYVLRARGWHKSYREWPRWARLAAQGSPRYWIYFAAAMLAFQDSAGRDDNRLMSRLPVPLTGNDCASNGKSELAAAVAWNYRAFLTGTRS